MGQKAGRGAARAGILAIVAACAVLASCSGTEQGAPPRDTGGTDTGTGTGADAGPDADSDSDADGDGDADDLTDAGPDCTGCPSVGDAGVGHSLANLACAVDLCGTGVVLDNQLGSPTGAQTQGAYAAVERFGDAANDLAPRLNGSYALLATGTATGKNHSVSMGGGSASDPYASDSSTPIYDAMEWTLHLKAPQGAHGFEVDYVFFSEEYDEYVGWGYNDKFYIFLEAPSTNNGKRTVINFTECRKGTKGDMTCDQALADMGLCTVGDKLCHIAVNTALSECCWYGGCPNGTATTDISGTGFSCAPTKGAETIAGGMPGPFGDKYGSSTGWLRTEWTIEPGEEFDIVFHVHDTNDEIYDSEVILDRFLFLEKADPGTTPVE
jgi:hypothetical protein